MPPSDLKSSAHGNSWRFFFNLPKEYCFFITNPLKMKVETVVGKPHGLGVKIPISVDSTRLNSQALFSKRHQVQQANGKPPTLTWKAKGKMWQLHFRGKKFVVEHGGWYIYLLMAEIRRSRTSWYMVVYPIIYKGVIHLRLLSGFLNHEQYFFEPLPKGFQMNNMNSGQASGWKQWMSMTALDSNQDMSPFGFGICTFAIRVPEMLTSVCTA